MRQKDSKIKGKEKVSWIENIMGTFENDELYKEAMTLAKNCLNEIPRIVPMLILTYEPKIITNGKSIIIKLEAENKLNEDYYLTLKIISEENECILERSITFPKVKTISFDIPDDWQEKDYELRVIYQNWILASEMFEIVSKEDVKQEN